MKLFRRPKLTRQPVRSNDRALPTSFSYHARRAEQEVNTGRELERQTTPPKPRLSLNRLHQVGLIGLSIIIIIIVINFLSLSDKAQVKILTSDQNRPLLRAQATYQAGVNQLLAGSIWNRNKITLDTASLSHQLTIQFPELAAASVSWPLFGHQPTVYLQPIQPGLILAASNGAFILDSQGKAVLRAATPEALAATKLPVVTDDSSLTLKVSQQALPNQDISFIQTVVAQFQAKQTGITSMNLPPAASELDVHLVGVSYSVKFNLANNDARQQVGTFLATQAQLQRQHISPGKYIDVRVDGRAYYQ